MKLQESCKIRVTPRKTSARNYAEKKPLEGAGDIATPQKKRGDVRKLEIITINSYDIFLIIC